MRVNEIISNFSLREPYDIMTDMENNYTNLPEDNEPIFEMANLVQSQTGVDGIIHISTKRGSHGPRVKYYFGKPSQGRLFSVSISSNPKVVTIANSLTEKEVNGMAPLVITWVRLNHEKLKIFWNTGTDLTSIEVNDFIKSLTRYSYE